MIFGQSLALLVLEGSAPLAEIIPALWPLQTRAEIGLGGEAREENNAATLGTLQSKGSGSTKTRVF